MWLKAVPLIVFALFIDILQLGVTLSIAGALFGLNYIPFVGSVLSFAGAPLGFALGVAINSSIGLSAGAGLTWAIFLAYSSHGVSRTQIKVESIILRRIFIALFGEIIPVINNLPWWTIGTIITIRSIHKAEKKALAEAATAPEPEVAAPYPVMTADIRPTTAANDNRQPYAIAA